MEITLGNSNTTTTISDPPSTSNESLNCIVKTKNAIQVDVENKELAISPQNKTKISDKIIRILNNSDETATSSTDNSQEMTQTDVLLKEYNNGNKSSSSSGGGEVQITEIRVNKNNTAKKNLLEDTQVDEANINNMILNKKVVEKDTVTVIRKGKKRSVGSIESSNNESLQTKTLKLNNPELRHHNVIINESAAELGNKYTEEETDPLALVEVKTEPYSDEESMEIVKTVTKQNNGPPKPIDNLTRVINAVATGSTTITKTKNQKSYPPQKQTPLKKSNKARKSFPSPAKPTDNPIVTFTVQPTQSAQTTINPAPPLVRIGQNKEVNVETPIISSSLPSRIELNESQNYIPLLPQNSALMSPPLQTNSSIASTSQMNVSNGTATTACLSSIMEEFSTLKDSLPEAAAKAVSDLICKPPPKLKPRPPSAISDGFEECIPSSAGQITAKLNSVAYRVSSTSLM